MKFCDLAKVLHKYRMNRSEKTSECVKVLTDAILDDIAMESLGDSNKEKNPMYGKGESTLQSYFNGTRNISQKDAALIAGRVDEAHFADFVNEFSFDALAQLSVDIQAFGFDVYPDTVAEVCANIMAQIINNLAEGKSDDISTLTIKKKELGKRIKDIAPTTIERRGDKLHICGEEIVIHSSLIPDKESDEPLRYIKALCEAYADALNRKSLTEDEISTLPQIFQDDYEDQQEAFFSAFGIEHSIRDSFDDGEDEFEKLKKDAWQGINMTYRRSFPNGYERLITVLEKITNTTLSYSVLSQIRSLIGNLEKKGICHILVNDGIINSWVNIYG